MKNLLSIILILLSIVVVSQKTPKILVCVVVDQMKYEFVDRFWGDFGDNGFNKIRNEYSTKSTARLIIKLLN